MSDLLQIQNFLHHGLRSCQLFDAHNVVMERKWLMDSSVEFDTLWMTPRKDTGVERVGNGLLVEMPRLEIPKPNSPQRNLVVSIVSIEERILNYGENGTKVSAEELSELALDFMYAWQLGSSSGLTPETAAVTPAPDVIEADAGILAYRASLSVRRSHVPLSRCDSPTANLVGSTLTLTPGAAPASAVLYYHIETPPGVPGVFDVVENFPGPSNAGAVLYTVPFTVASGQVIRWCAYHPDYLPSHITLATIE